MSTTKTVRTTTMVYRNTERRLQTHGHVNPKTGKFIASLSPTKLTPGTVFEATEEEYDDLRKAGAIEDVDLEAAPQDDLIG